MENKLKEKGKTVSLPSPSHSPTNEDMHGGIGNKIIGKEAQKTVSTYECRIDWKRHDERI